MTYISVEELMAGSGLNYDLEVPSEVINPGSVEEHSLDKIEMRLKLKPLSMNAVQRILKASRDDDGLMSALMVKESVIEPLLSYDAVMKLNSGLIRFILEEVQRISGLKTRQDELTDAVQEPLAKACFVLAREFGWSPQEVAELTLGQILMYVEMIRQKEVESQTAC